MIPREPPRREPYGFLYIPPFRIQGISVAGEETVVQVPELDICFDIGSCPRSALASPYVGVTHAHMDHCAGIAYYFSQRYFQGMGVGTMVCHPELEQPIRKLMEAWIALEGQRTPHNLIPLAPEGEIEIKPRTYLRAYETNHTVPSLGYVVVERRSKLRPELAGMPQEQIIERKKRGEPVTETHEIPLVAFTGDTAWGPHFDRPDVLDAQILITECTFLESGHRSRAGVGKHLHLEDVVSLVKRCRSEAVVLTHLSRRTHMAEARKQIQRALTPEQQERVFVLMDGRTNRARYQRQLAESQDQPGDAEAEEATAQAGPRAEE